MYVVCKENIVLYGYVYSTYRHKHALFTHGYRQLLRVRVDTDTRFRPYDDECDRTPVWTNRARHTDFPCKRRILNYGFCTIVLERKSKYEAYAMYKFCKDKTKHADW